MSENIIWRHKSKHEYDAFHEVGILKYDAVYISYCPRHLENLKRFMEDVHDKAKKTPFEYMFKTNIKRAQFVLDVIDGGYASKKLDNVPYELAVFGYEWGWFRKGHEIFSDGVISRAYGVTTSGLGVQVIDNYFAYNLARRLYMALALLIKFNPAVSGVIDALMLWEAEYERLVEKGDVFRADKQLEQMVMV